MERKREGVSRGRTTWGREARGGVARQRGQGRKSPNLHPATVLSASPATNQSSRKIHQPWRSIHRFRGGIGNREAVPSGVSAMDHAEKEGEANLGAEQRGEGADLWRCPADPEPTAANREAPQPSRSGGRLV